VVTHHAATAGLQSASEALRLKEYRYYF